MDGTEPRYTHAVATIDELRAQALKLPAADRAKLACDLLESLDEDEHEDVSQEHIEQAWDDEIERRTKEIDEGRAELLTEEEFWKLVEG
jgi:putative addiction module component (TIGR02574 family)